MDISVKINECYQLLSRTNFAELFLSVAKECQLGDDIASVISQIKTQSDFIALNGVIKVALSFEINPIKNNLYLDMTEDLLKQVTKESKELFVSDIFLILTLLDLDIKESILAFVAERGGDLDRFDIYPYSELDDYIYGEYGFEEHNLPDVYLINYLQEILKGVDGLLFAVDRRFGHYINESTRTKILSLQTEQRVGTSFFNVNQEKPNEDESLEVRRLVWNGDVSYLTELTIALISAELLKFERGSSKDGEVGAAFMNTLLPNKGIDPPKYNRNIQDVKGRTQDDKKILIPNLAVAFDKYMVEGRKKYSKKKV